MDWSNEPYVKVYTRETDDDLVLSWEARAVWDRMLTKFDRSGLIETRRGAHGLAAIVRIPRDIVARVMPELLQDGRVREVPSGYFSPNFIPAQEAKKGDALRQKELRDRRRSKSLSGQSVTERDGSIPIRNDESQKRDEPSRDFAPQEQNVTLCSASADPNALHRDALTRAIPGGLHGTGAPPATEPPDANAPKIRARRTVGDRAWDRLNDIRQRVAADRGWRDVRQLHPQDPGRLALAQRLAEAGDRGEADANHVLDIAEAEAFAKGTVEFLNGALFDPVPWRKKLSMRVDDVKRASSANGTREPERTYRVPKATSDEPDFGAYDLTPSWAVKPAVKP